MPSNDAAPDDERAGDETIACVTTVLLFKLLIELTLDDELLLLATLDACVVDVGVDVSSVRCRAASRSDRTSISLGSIKLKRLKLSKTQKFT